MCRDWSTSAKKAEDEGAGIAQPGEEELRGISHVYKYLKGRCREDAVRLLSAVPGERLRYWAQTRMQEVFPRH